MTFDDWWSAYPIQEDYEANCRDAYQAGAASRDAEIAELVSALRLWKLASNNSEESELDDMACYCVPMPLFCDADEAMGDALAKVRKL